MKPIFFAATLVIYMAITLGVCGQEAGKKLPPAPEGVTIEQGVAYLAPGRTETADLYLPAQRAKDVRSAAVVIIHGGGWTGGDKAAAREFNIGTNLALKGYVAISINYALATKDKATWPQNLHDCLTAVRWLRKNAERLRIDPDHIGVIGGSAGGHLAAMVGVVDAKDGLDPKGPYGEFSCRVQCAVPMYGPMDLTEHADLSMLGKTRAQAPELYRAASPVTYVRKSTPPMLILHGTADKTVDVKQSELFAAALKKVGAVHELVIVEGAPHTFHLQPKQRDLRPVVLGFFDKYLKAAEMNFLAKLAERDKQPEIMDQPGLETARHQTALLGLARINRISLSDRILWRPIERLARQNPKAKLRVLDIGTGGGDVPVRLCQRARRAGLPIEFAGADISGTAIDCARAHARRFGADVEFFQLDALEQSLPAGYDILTSSLFLHHLETPQAIDLLRRMGQAAGSAVLINDLVRSRLGYLLAWIGTRVLSRSPIVHVDGPLSVGAAFTILEARQLAEQAGLRGDGRLALALPLPAGVEATTTTMMIAATVDLMEAGARSWDAIVVGAGPAGSLAARALARHGAAVLLVDKSRFPRAKVCGGCLNLQALSTLSAVGLGGLVERCGAVPLSSLELAVSGSRARVSSSGKALSREVFDAALLKAAIEAGVRFLPETHAHLAPVCGPTRTLALNRKGQEAVARGRVVLGADGLGGGLLAGQADVRAVVAAGSRLGAGVIAAEFPACFAPGTVYMACGRGGYVGLVRIEDGRLNIAAAFDAALVKRAGGLGNAAAAVLREAGFASIDRLATLSWHGTPMLTRHASRPATERMFLLGDAASFVEPFSGEGMAWAMDSAVAVVPFALRACRDWHASLVRQWSMRYRQTILKRQWVCRATANILRQPYLARLIVATLTHFPVLAAPIVRYVNHARL